MNKAIDDGVKACRAQQTGPDPFVCDCGEPPCVPAGVPGLHTD